MRMGRINCIAGCAAVALLSWSSVTHSASPAEPEFPWVKIEPRSFIDNVVERHEAELLALFIPYMQKYHPVVRLAINNRPNLKGQENWCKNNSGFCVGQPLEDHFRLNWSKVPRGMLVANKDSITDVYRINKQSFLGWVTPPTRQGGAPIVWNCKNTPDEFSLSQHDVTREEIREMIRREKERQDTDRVKVNQDNKVDGSIKIGGIGASGETALKLEAEITRFVKQTSVSEINKEFERTITQAITRNVSLPPLSATRIGVSVMSGVQRLIVEGEVWYDAPLIFNIYPNPPKDYIQPLETRATLSAMQSLIPALKAARARPIEAEVDVVSTEIHLSADVPHGKYATEEECAAAEGGYAASQRRLVSGADRATALPPGFTTMSANLASSRPLSCTAKATGTARVVSQDRAVADFTVQISNCKAGSRFLSAGGVPFDIEATDSDGRKTSRGPYYGKWTNERGDRIRFQADARLGSGNSGIKSLDKVVVREPVDCECWTE